MRHLIQSTVAALAVAGSAITSFGGVISSIDVTPTRPTTNALVTWDIADSSDPDKYNAWAVWTRTENSSRRDPGQSFYLAQTAMVSGFAVQLNSTLTNENIVRGTNGDSIYVDLETFPNGTTVSPSGTVGWPANPASFTGNLPGNFDDNATNYGHWVTFTFDAPVQLTGGAYYGFRLGFNAAEAAPNDGGHDIKLNVGNWGDNGATSIDGRVGFWIGGYSSDGFSEAEDLQFVLIGVPEPSSIGLIGLLGAGLLARGRR